MKNLFLFLLITLISLTSSTSYQPTLLDADKVLGIWQTEEKDGKIEIYKQNGKYYGKLIWGARMFETDGKTSKKDVKNSDKVLQSRNLQNLIILTDFIFSGSKWEDGKIYDPDSGKTYSCVMKFDGEKLKITGYIGFSWIGKTVLWTKVQ
jgi:uncharacterized protein (DUF2147 family)